MAKTDEQYAADARVKDAERELADAIKYDRPEWKIKELRKEVDAAKRIQYQADRRR